MISQETSFKQEQMRYPRVRTAYAEKEDQVNSLLEKNDLVKEDLKLFIRAFKDVGILEVWACSSGQDSFKPYSS